MADWSASMKQTYEYYVVDPGTWKDIRKLDTVKTATISRDSSVQTLGSATIDVTESTGECYIRVYLVTIQNGLKEKHPLGTFIVQTPSSSFDGKIQNISMDAYTPLIELKENPPPIGYTRMKGDNVMQAAYQIVRENVRAPVVPATCDKNLDYDFVANTDDNWVSYVSDLIGTAEYSFELDELGRILFSPKQDTASLQPVWTYTDDNSSILYPELDLTHDLYAIPNVVEVVYSSNSDTHSGVHYACVENNDPNSPVSIVNRGRRITQRVTNPEFNGIPSQRELDLYAERVLRELSTVTNTVSYTHGYCPVRVGDCVRLNYARAGIRNVKAKVISQSIKCTPGCPVTEKAVFTTKLWG